jgi:hypothetical protein
VNTFTFKVIVAVKEITCFEYEIEASDKHDAERQALLKHYANESEGKLVDREEWANEIHCLNDEYYEEEPQAI